MKEFEAELRAEELNYFLIMYYHKPRKETVLSGSLRMLIEIKTTWLLIT